MPYTTTLQALLSEIKVEARVSGSDNLNIWITALINELIQAHARTERYYELASVDEAGGVITLVDGQPSYNLPADFADMMEVWWSNDKTQPRQRTLRHKNDFVEESRNGVEPRYYVLTGSKIRVFPYANILSVSHDLRLDYYKIPNLLANPTDAFAIGKLIPVIKREAVSRVLKHTKDLQGSQLSQADADKVAKGQMTTEENAS